MTMIRGMRRRWQLRHRHSYLSSGRVRRVSLGVGLLPACFEVEECACGAYRWVEVDC